MGEKLRDKSLNWRSIAQNVVPPITVYAKKRLFCSKVKICFAVIGLVSILIFLYLLKFLLEKKTLPSYLTTDLQCIKKIDFSTDGVLKREQFSKFLYGISNEHLMNLDLFSLKEKFETISQVKAAVLEREFPFTLCIKLSEYKPIAKIVIKNKGYFISEEGYLFRGRGYSKAVIKCLPYLEGFKIVLDKKNQLYRISHIESVRSLLELARFDFPTLYTQWQSISMEYVNEISGIISSFIKIRTRNNIEIFLAPDEFELQLKRLSLILAYASKEKLKTIERIDLTLNNQAAVKIAKRGV